MRLLVLLLVPILVCQGRPQGDEGVSADDITKKSGGSYDQSAPQVDSDLIKELFGGHGTPLNQNYKPPKKENIKEDQKHKECSFYEEDSYRCVPYYQCDDGEIITDGGPGLIDLRGNFGLEIELDPDNSKCKGDLEVCCRLPEAYGEPLKPKVLPYTSKCGTRNENGIGVRITNDQYKAKTQFGEFPFMCAVLEEQVINGQKKNLFVAGASLIAPGVAMTAAHSVDDYTKPNANPLKVRCGEWDTQTTNEPAPHQDRYVNKININPSYSNTNYSSDIALLFTTEEFVLSAHIDVVCLPSVQEMQDSYQKQGCFATGWGKDRFDESGEYQVILKKVELDMVSPYQCQAALRTTKLGKFFKLDPTFACAGGNADVDTCKGDGGGPLVCPTGKNNGYGPQYVQSGIVAWGVECGKRDVPGVYTDVADMLCYIDWATRCELGDRDHYGVEIRGCRHWATRERNRLQDGISAYQYQLDQLSQDSTDPGYQQSGQQVNDRSLKKLRKKLTKRLKKHKRALKKFNEALNHCNFGNKEEIEDFDDYDDDLDLSGYQRIHDSLDRKTAILQSKSAPSE